MAHPTPPWEKLKPLAREMRKNPTPAEEALWQHLSKRQADDFPEQVFHSIYAVLYAPSYREKYADFLRLDFPASPSPPSRGSLKPWPT
ncbi:MAG: type ISP restriction/modification enzyme [Anaerolineae bacterium]